MHWAGPRHEYDAGKIVRELLTRDIRISWRDKWKSATHRDDAHFAVEVVGPEGNPSELLVNTLGFYAGGRAMAVRSGMHRIQIIASGEWEVLVEQPVADGAEAPPITHEGAGDFVLGPFLLSTHPSQATMTHRGTSNFLMTLLAL